MNKVYGDKTNNYSLFIWYLYGTGPLICSKPFSTTAGGIWPLPQLEIIVGPQGYMSIENVHMTRR